MKEAQKERDNAKELLRKFEEAQQKKEIAEFQGVLNGALAILNNTQITNCLEPWRMVAIDSMRVKYPNVLELQERIKEIDAKRKLKKCDD